MVRAGLLAAGVAAVWLMGGVVSGQEHGARAPAEEPGAPALLGGPAVEDEQTLVRRDASGRIAKLKIWPSEAALELMELSEEARASVERVLNERSAAFEKVLRENLEMVQQLAQAGEAEEWGRAMMYLGQFYDRLRDEIGAEQLEQRLEDALPMEQAEEFRRLVNEYWDALVVEELGEEARGFGSRVREAVTRRLASIELFAEEIGRAYQRMEQDNSIGVEYVIDRLGLREAQKPEARRILLEMMAEHGPEPADAEWARALKRISVMLDCEQKAKMLDLVLEEVD